MASTGDNVLPQALSDFIKSSGVNRNKCCEDKGYWEDHTQKCKDEGHYYNKDKGSRSDDKNHQQCKRWKKHDKKTYDKECKKVLADFFTHYKDAELIFDILTAGRDNKDIQDKDIQNKDIQDEDIQDGDSKDNLEETHDT